MKLSKRLILIGIISGVAFVISSGISLYQNHLAKQVAIQAVSDLQDGQNVLFMASHAGAVFAKQRVAWKDTLLRSGNAEAFKKAWADFAALDRETDESLHKLEQYEGRFGLAKADIQDALAQHAKVDADYFRLRPD